MKITIDTKEDSHEDMKHVLEMLTNLLRKNSSEPVHTIDMMSMFDAPAAKEAPAMPMSMFNTPVKESGDSQLFSMSQHKQSFERKEVPNTPPDFTAFLNLTKENQDNNKDHEPQVEYF